MDGKEHGSHRPDRDNTGSPDRRGRQVDEIHRLGWLGYVVALLVLLILLLIAGRAMTGWMSGYTDAAVEQSAAP